MRRVLVFQLARFGDLVQTKRLMLTLAADKETEAHLCVDSSLTSLARALYPFAVVHGLPAHRGDGDLGRALSSVRHCLAGLAGKDFETVYFLNFSPLSYALSSLFDPDQQRGYARVRGQERRSPLAMLAFNLMRNRRFSPINLTDFWAFFHPAPIAPENVNPIPGQKSHGRIGIVMAGRESRRSLPPPILAKCVQAVFQARGGPALVCLGSKGEAPLVNRLARELPSKSMESIENLCGKTGLTDLAEIVAGLDLVLTPDTGIMHLAAHLGVPVQAFFLASAWCWETGPYGFGHKIWQALPTCSPCREGDACTRKLACLDVFSHKGFLAHLAGKHDADWPEGLMGCVGVLDDLGATYRHVDGEDPFAQTRSELRSGLHEYLIQTEKSPAQPFMRPELAGFLFTDKDWMLPQALAAKTVDY